MRPIKNWDEEVVAVDFETSGSKPEYSLQPWRIKTQDFWATSLAWVRHSRSRLRAFGGLAPDYAMMEEFLCDAAANKWRLLCWNAPFDISVFIAYGFEDLVMEIDWLDGMLIWRHLEIEPEYEVDRAKKKSFSLKQAVREYLPKWAGYEEDVDYHDTSPEARDKLHKYNIRDNTFTYQITRHLWGQLTPQQQKCALIEADCLPLVASANYHGMKIDTLYAKSLAANLDATAAQLFEELKDDGVTEAIVRSPTQLANLLYNVWGLPILKHNEGKKTGKISRATDKEVLHELAFIDPRAKKLKQFREALNNKTKFAVSPLVAAEYNCDGRAHPLANVFGTYTGRLTYSSKQTTRKTKAAQTTEDAE
jgi:DNA polymerase I-like protein with 3'-5' exonuclease and polymerase domains